MPAIPGDTISKWASGPKSEQVAAKLAIWAAAQPAGTMVPDEDEIIGDLDSVTRPTSVRRALTLLTGEGALRHDEGIGRYYTTGDAGDEARVAPVTTGAG
jgi:DNA-binding FadR family transcriptional regulator